MRKIHIVALSSAMLAGGLAGILATAVSAPDARVQRVLVPVTVPAIVPAVERDDTPKDVALNRGIAASKSQSKAHAASPRVKSSPIVRQGGPLIDPKTAPKAKPKPKAYVPYCGQVGNNGNGPDGLPCGTPTKPRACQFNCDGQVQGSMECKTNPMDLTHPVCPAKPLGAL